MRKRILSLLLAVMLVVSLVPVGALADSSGYSGNFGAEGDGSNIKWAYDNDTQTLSFTGSGKMAGVSYDGWNNLPWHNYAIYIKHIVIGDGITNIGDNMTKGTAITSIEIPSSVTDIGANAFDGSKQLESVTIPGTVKYVGELAFAYCDSLKSVVIESGVSSIRGAFDGCKALESVTLGGDVAMSDGTFSYCDSIKNVTLGADVTSFDPEMIKSPALTSYNVEFGNKSYISGDRGELLSYDGKTLIRCPRGISGEYELQNGITALSKGAFKDCPKLTGITLPASVTSFGGSLFSGCTSLANVTLSEGITKVADDMFTGCTSLKTVKLPSTITYLGAAFTGCTALESIEIPDGVKSIPRYTFSGCTSLNSVKLPAELNEIAQGAFRNCTSLESISFPDTLTLISIDAFRGCTSLNNVVLPKSLGFLSGGSFMDCTSLESIVVPDGAEGLYSVPNQDGSSDYCGAFTGCTSLKTITIPDSVTKIQEASFKGCTALTDVYYVGSQEDFNKINFDKTDNDPFVNATKHFHTHNFTLVGYKPATCEDNGYTGDQVCADCGKVIKGEFQPRLGHNFVRHDGKDPTCTEAGYYGYYECTRCGKIFNDNYEESYIHTIPAHGHDFVDGKCIYCGELDPTYHAHTLEHFSAVEPTCTTPGTEEYWRCSGCGKFFSDAEAQNEISEPVSIPALGHTTELRNAKAATCTEAGYTGDEVCTRCGETVTKGRTIPALGHNFVNGVCTRCGEREQVKPAVKFSDVGSKAYYAAPVAWAVERGITNGFPGGVFLPDDNCTRAQIVTFLWREAGSPKASAASSGFSDVSAKSYYYDAVVWAVNAGITNGFPGGVFKPDDPCTRGQIVTFIWRSFHSPAPTAAATFSDVPSTAYFASAVRWAVENDITNGFPGGVFLPNDTCTRGQAVTFIYRAYGK